jgi:hypothetical protein
MYISSIHGRYNTHRKDGKSYMKRLLERTRRRYKNIIKKLMELWDERIWTGNF